MQNFRHSTDPRLPQEPGMLHCDYMTQTRIESGEAQARDHESIKESPRRWAFILSYVYVAFRRQHGRDAQSVQDPHAAGRGANDRAHLMPRSLSD